MSDEFFKKLDHSPCVGIYSNTVDQATKLDPEATVRWIREEAARSPPTLRENLLSLARSVEETLVPGKITSGDGGGNEE